MPTTVKISVEISIASSPEKPDRREAELVSLGKELANLHGLTLSRDELIGFAKKWVDELSRGLNERNWVAELGADLKRLQSGNC